MHLSRTGSHSAALLGLSGAMLKMLQQALNDMLTHTDDPHWARLQALQLELDKAIDQTERAQS